MNNSGYVCGACGAPLPAGATQCPSCGAPVIIPPSPQPAPVKKKKGKGCLIALAVVLAVLIILTAVIVLLWKKISQSDFYLILTNEGFSGIISEYFQEYDDEDTRDYAAEIFEERKWQDSEYTRLLPEPQFGTSYNERITAGAFTADISGAEYSQVAEYIASVKSAGFVNNVTENDMPDAGIYVYEAEKENGDSVKITFLSGAFTLKLRIRSVDTGTP